MTTDSPAAVPVDVPSDVLVESSSEAPDVLVVGEALIDAVDPGGSGAGVGGGVTEHVGGSPANVAFGLAALGHPVRLATWFGRDDRGARIARACTEHGVRLVAGSDGADHTSLAQATLDAHGQASYRFDLTWQVPSAAGVDPVGSGHVHTGSIAATLEPGGTQVLALIEALHGSATVSYDPNIRPSLMGSPDEVRDRIEAIIALVDVVKASDEDLQWLYPGSFIPDVLRRWGALGPYVTVVTRGGKGAMYAVRSATAAQVTSVPARAATVLDTVGAGDSFMAGLVSGLLDGGYVGRPDSRDRLATAGIDDLRAALDRAIATSGCTVGRAGAYAPTRAEL